MIRILALIAGIGFILSVACLAGAAALGGNDIRHGWRMPESWRVHIRDDDGSEVTFGPDGVEEREANRTTRTLTWVGGQRLEVSLPASIHYTQAAGPVRLTVSGPRELVDRVRLDGPRLHADGPMGFRRRLRVEMTAPDVSTFQLNGAGRLDIAGYDRPTLDIESNGASQVIARGRAGQVSLRISGAGDADLSHVRGDAARVEISGAGNASVAPRQRAEIRISGAGNVTLATRPAHVDQDISGVGRVIQSDEPLEDDDAGSATTNAAVPAPDAPPAPAAVNAAPASR
jgi:hypothetical protein